jgi:hypothetical protein
MSGVFERLREGMSGVPGADNRWWTGIVHARDGRHPGGSIANAVFHATGRRIRELPITPDKLL